MVHTEQTEPSLLAVQAEAAGVRPREFSGAAEMLESLEEGEKAPMPGQLQNNKSTPPGLERWRHKKEAPRIMKGRGKRRKEE